MSTEDIYMPLYTSIVAIKSTVVINTANRIDTGGRTEYLALSLRVFLVDKP
jgi:hypothetical protein